MDDRGTIIAITWTSICIRKDTFSQREGESFVATI